MISFLTDENFNNRILPGLLRLEENIDIVRVQDTSYYKADDTAILGFALAENRALLTHDIKTIPVFFGQNLEAGIANPAVFVVPESMPIKDVINDLFLIAVCSDLEEWIGTLHILPL